jgi:hypothetical protein
VAHSCGEKADRRDEDQGRPDLAASIGVERPGKTKKEKDASAYYPRGIATFRGIVGAGTELPRRGSDTDLAVRGAT